MRIIIFILISVLFSGCDYYRYQHCTKYRYFEEVRIDVNTESIDTLILSSNGHFSILEESSDNVNKEFQKDYMSEYKLANGVVAVKVSSPITRGVWTSYWTNVESEFYKECNRKGKPKRNPKKSYEFFETNDINISQTDSIVEVRKFRIYKNDTTNRRFMDRYVYRSNTLIESWSGYCHMDVQPCEWDNIRQCHKRKFENLANDSLITRYFDCNSDSIPYLTIYQKKYRDKKARVVQINETREYDSEHRQFDEYATSKVTFLYYFHENGYLEKEEKIKDDNMVYRKTIKKL